MYEPTEERAVTNTNYKNSARKLAAVHITVFILWKVYANHISSLFDPAMELSHLLQPMD